MILYTSSSRARGIQDGPEPSYRCDVVWCEPAAQAPCVAIPSCHSIVRLEWVYILHSTTYRCGDIRHSAKDTQPRWCTAAHVPLIETRDGPELSTQDHSMRKSGLAMTRSLGAPIVQCAILSIKTVNLQREYNSWEIASSLFNWTVLLRFHCRLWLDRCIESRDWRTACWLQPRKIYSIRRSNWWATSSRVSYWINTNICKSYIRQDRCKAATKN